MYTPWLISCRNARFDALDVFRAMKCTWMGKFCYFIVLLAWDRTGERSEDGHDGEDREMHGLMASEMSRTCCEAALMGTTPALI
jgi:hypothetical protein